MSHITNTKSVSDIMYTGPALKSNAIAPVVYGIASNRSYKQHGRHWYHVARLVKLETQWYEVCWLPTTYWHGTSHAALRKTARLAGILLERGIFYMYPFNSCGDCMVWSEDDGSEGPKVGT